MGGVYFIDGTDEAQEGVFVSETTGQELSYFNWRDGEPNGAGVENCVIISAANGEWLDTSCTSNPRHALCQRKSEATFCLVTTFRHWPCQQSTAQETTVTLIRTCTAFLLYVQFKNYDDIYAENFSVSLYPPAVTC